MAMKSFLIKRVIGLPGDKIDISDGKVYINGEELVEDYTKEGYTTGDVDGLVVPDGKVFCMGDNRRVSIDSRSPEVGCIDMDEVVGKSLLEAVSF